MQILLLVFIYLYCILIYLTVENNVPNRNMIDCLARKKHLSCDLYVGKTKSHEMWVGPRRTEAVNLKWSMRNNRLGSHLHSKRNGVNRRCCCCCCCCCPRLAFPQTRKLCSSKIIWFDFRIMHIFASNLRGWWNEFHVCSELPGTLLRGLTKE